MSAPAAPCPTDIPVAHAPIAPLPPAMWMRTRSALASPIFWRWVVLSVLLHVLAILLFGSPAGGHREGRAMFGRLSVVIKEGWRDTGPDLRIEREMAPKPVDPTPPPSRTEASRTKPPPAPPVEPAASREPSPLAQPPTAEAPAPVPQMLERLPATEPKQELLPAPKVPPAVEAPPAPPAPPALMDRVTAPKVERTLVEPPPAPAPIPLPAPPAMLDPVPAPRVDRPLMEAPPTPPATLERLPAPRIERQLIEAPPTPPATLERLPAPRIERQLMEPPPMPAPAPAVPTPAPMATPAPAQAAPVAPPAPATTPAPARDVPPQPPTAPRAAETAKDPLPAPLPQEKQGSRPAPLESPFRRSQPEPSTTYDPTAAPPSLDLDTIRKRAGELGRAGTGNRAALPFPMPPVPEKKSRLEDAIEKARKPDCREAYKHLGLAAVVPLIANEFGEGKCKW